MARSVLEEQRKILAKERERREVVEREMASMREDLEGWKEGCEQYEGCYRYWEKVAKDRGMLVEELWRQVPVEGSGSIESRFYGSGPPWQYYWIDVRGQRSWEWPGEGEGPTREQVCEMSGVE